jgi:predicted AAA+ superfamily ATPase
MHHAAVAPVVSQFMTGADPAIVARAPAGAGKSSLVRAAVLQAAGKKRMFVTAP